MKRRNEVDERNEPAAAGRGILRMVFLVSELHFDDRLGRMVVTGGG